MTQFSGINLHISFQLSRFQTTAAFPRKDSDTCLEKLRTFSAIIWYFMLKKWLTAHVARVYTVHDSSVYVC